MLTKIGNKNFFMDDLLSNHYLYYNSLNFLKVFGGVAVQKRNISA
ncbi:hypothetical protein HMPREF0549_1101 [Limosilactobacillus vaginalis DSM 5837 = ATCC 49540]|uniref:Uncharacterized protein n=1 Tax=Limosilactobacillus vaginalis DSM 5837 = ATCC 49540 TaxID=1423814 RepID=C2EUG5_9LACO|nr:hypothetical protein HMPREF0549_1101 [Limosilactobacillus vaginalis DSM 5837 = ATCC 49540]